MLETFLSSGWPKNQHGYKSGRGVHTIWNQVLLKILKAKYIIEFDFRGFFNTVKVEAVGKVLNKYQVPKYMIANILLISSGDVDNISTNKMLEYLNSVDPDEAGWYNAWRKYENIHKFRRGYKDTGLAQGGVLSPLLSVLTLIVLDELEEKGIKYILYCDDGLLYTEEDVDALSIAQEILDRHNIGAYFAMDKCKWLKKDDVWLHKLKLVGLEYDPWTDVLAASTRNGATLKLEVGSFGIFSENPIEREKLPVIKEERWQDWRVSNEALFKSYENLYITENLPGDATNNLIDSLALQTYLLMKNRFRKYDPFTLSSILINEEVTETTLTDLIAPLRLLKNIGKEYLYELVEEYEKLNSCDFPWQLLMENPDINENYWMDDKDAIGDRLNTLIKEKCRALAMTQVKDITYTDVYSPNPTIEALVAFHDLSELPENLKSKFKDGELGLGDWIGATFAEAGIKEISDEIAKHMAGNLTWFGYTQVTWRQLYMDPIFATFIARLFQNSFKSNVVKQNFKLTHDSNKNNMLKLIYKFIGKQSLNKVLDDGGMNVFNSSSICSNLLNNLMEILNQ